MKAMGIVKNVLTNTVNFIAEEILPIRYELRKAGLLSPATPTDYEPKASLIDPFSYNASIHGYKEKYTLIDYSKCRQISYSDPVISAIIQTRTNQVAAFAVQQENRFRTGFKITLREKSKKIGGAAKKKAQELERFLLQCGFPETMDDTPKIRKRDSLETFLRKIVRDTLTFDQLNFEVIPRKNGLPAQFKAVDASTIRIVPDEDERKKMYGGTTDPRMNLPLSVVPIHSDLSKIRQAEVPKYAQVINGTPRAVFDEWEMGFGVRNPRSDILSNGYGFSEVEMLLPIITAHINADTYNRKFFSQGSSQKGIISFEGQVPPDQLEAFRRQWHQQVSGVQNAWKTPIIATGKDSKLNWVSLHSTNKEMEWGKYIEYLIKTICSVYQIDPIELGFDISKNGSGQSSGSGGLGGQGQQVERLKYSKDKGLDPLLRFIATLINEYIIWRIDPDLEFQFVGLNSTSEKEQLDMDASMVGTFKLLDELRAEYDLPPIPKPEDVTSPGQMVMNAQFIQAFQAIQGGGMDAMGGGEMGQDQEDQPLSDGQDQEPDYESMSDEELQSELSRLKGGAAQKSFIKAELEI